ncbi:MAG TPA: HAMP domain-containing sensor histidine kinase [Polyangiaceae bacterium]|nr:HAMP domain-containing sensor histidine kinase [Polyangiaceae bacterium]
MSLRRRLVGAVTGMTMLALGGALAALWFAFNDAQRRQLDRALVELAAQIARETARAGPPPPRLPEHPGPVANDVELPNFTVVYGAGGRPVSKTDAVVEPPPLEALRGGDPPEVFDFDAGGRRFRGVLREVPGGELTVLVATTRADIDGDARLLARAMGLVFALGSLWAAFSASWFVGRMTRQHEALRALAHRVAGGELEARLDESGRPADDKQLTADINRMVERLEHLVRAQQRFVAHAAHELRSPLTSLSGELQRAVARPRAAEEYREAIGEALEETSRLTELANDLLAFASLGTAPGRGTSEVELAQLVDDVFCAVADEAHAAGAALALEGAAPPVFGHEGDLYRLARNLVENAIRHGRPAGRVRVRLGTAPGAATLAVEDDGPGVDPDERETVFEPFYRSPRARGGGVRGTGLGLAIAREIARSHGGDVSLDPAYAGGARFVVRLPLRAGP